MHNHDPASQTPAEVALDAQEITPVKSPKPLGSRPDPQFVSAPEVNTDIARLGVPISGTDSQTNSPIVIQLSRDKDPRTNGESEDFAPLSHGPIQELLERCENNSRELNPIMVSRHLEAPVLEDPDAHLLDQLNRLNSRTEVTVGPFAEPAEVANSPIRNEDGLPEKSTTQLVPSSIGRYTVSRILGQGGFGIVYLAHDAKLDRDVAIKVPLNGTQSRFLDVESYIEETRLLARLSHPNIVPVYDVGHIEDGRCYVVSKYMEGGDLKGLLRQGRPTFLESARLIAIVCEALHYTHTRALFHRDIKPANILLDREGVPSLADFGLALKDEYVGNDLGYVGTAAYLSPEQARGEGHRVDGRSDIFSIGIVLYELLTFRRPFRGPSKQGVMQQIVQAEPRPPRQIDDTIPRDLERICLKALSKRTAERYNSARDLADELRHFLNPAASITPASVMGLGDIRPFPVSSDWTEKPLAATAPSSKSAGQPIRIIPKGLASFDQDDADFFLELVPGPRDREGLPDSLRFWKSRIEATDPDRSFRVGLIYGPSGCGKSSIVKAGLIPILARHVTTVYIEASGKETENRLLRGIRKRFPVLPPEAGLVESMAILRRGQSFTAGSKAFVVIDQFERWLFAGQSESSTELVAALRHCDGVHLKALCLVRDDCWMAATKFMRELEIDLVPDRNVAAVDLFTPNHASKVLAAYGQAYETLPSNNCELSREEETFLSQAVGGLSQNGQIVPVHLALFAQMIKQKSWKTETLSDLGGMDDIGVMFLEESFSSSQFNPNHRNHLKAAQSVLKALLPEKNTDIKGRVRSHEELRIISGYTELPLEFADLIRVLDDELRLITPVDPESSIEEERSQPLGGRFYQLTHDYIVRPLQEWLTRKQKETRRGRAELLLAERSLVWSSLPDDRQLPSTLEWATIRLLTKPKTWTHTQRRMMHRSDRVVGLRCACISTLLAIVLIAGLATHFERLRNSLRTAQTRLVPTFIQKLTPLRWWIEPKLKRILEPDTSGS